MRRVYEIQGKVTRASGLLAWFVRGKPVEGFLIVDGSAEDFQFVVNRTFGVIGELIKAPFIERIPVAERRFGRVEVEPESRNFYRKFLWPNMTVALMIDISDDGRMLNRVEVDGSPTTVGRSIWLSGVSISGRGVITQESA